MNAVSFLREDKKLTQGHQTTQGQGSGPDAKAWTLSSESRLFCEKHGNRLSASCSRKLQDSSHLSFSTMESPCCSLGSQISSRCWIKSADFPQKSVQCTKPVHRRDRGPFGTHPEPSG